MENKELNMEKKNEEVILKESISKASQDLTPEDIEKVVGGLTSIQKRVFIGLGMLTTAGVAGFTGYHFGKGKGVSATSTTAEVNKKAISVDDAIKKLGLTLTDGQKDEVSKFVKDSNAQIFDENGSCKLSFKNLAGTGIEGNFNLTKSGVEKLLSGESNLM